MLWFGKKKKEQKEQEELEGSFLKYFHYDGDSSEFAFEINDETIKRYINKGVKYAQSLRYQRQIKRG